MDYIGASSLVEVSAYSEGIQALRTRRLEEDRFALAKPSPIGGDAQLLHDPVVIEYQPLPALASLYALRSALAFLSALAATRSRRKVSASSCTD